MKMRSFNMRYLVQYLLCIMDHNQGPINGAAAIGVEYREVQEGTGKYRKVQENTGMQCVTSKVFCTFEVFMSPFSTYLRQVVLPPYEDTSRYMLIHDTCLRLIQVDSGYLHQLVRLTHLPH